MQVFKLESDNQFVRAREGSSDLHIYEYMDDLNAFDLIHVSSSRWRESTAVGPSAAARFKTLEVDGVTIQGRILDELVKDLTWVDTNGGRFFPSVNRQGLCLMYVGSEPVKRVRINDHFGWSKYGVKPQQAGTTWSRWDMSSGAVLVDHLAANSTLDDGNKYSSVMWKKVVEEKDKVIEEKEKTESLLRKWLQEKEKEVVSLKAALRVLMADNS